MASRRDQLQSYQFMVARTLAAVVMREPDPVQAPPRRGLGALFAGAMVAVVALAGVGIIGIVTGSGGGGWRVDGAVVIERETGAAYVFRAGTLYPAVNYASARLAGSGAEPVRVPASALITVPRGPVVGIVGAPTSLPARDRVLRGPWSMCAATGTDEVGRAIVRTSLRVGTLPPDSRPLTAEESLVVRAAGATYLVWVGHRYLIPEAAAVLPSLYAPAPEPVEVSGAWLAGLPEGQPITRIAVPGRGGPAPALPGVRVGDLLYAEAGQGRQYYLVLADGLAPVTELQKSLVEGQYALTARALPLATANAAPKSSGLPARPVDGTAPPAVPPPVLALGRSATACVTAADGDTRVGVVIGAASPDPAGIATGSRSGQWADQIIVAPGGVAVVEAMPAPTAATGPLSLVTAAGIAFPVPTVAALRLLGYDPSDAVRLPAAFLQRLPVGPALDPDAAGRPVPIP
jgi:type VII secretion protein EccB